MSDKKSKHHDAGNPRKDTGHNVRKEPDLTDFASGRAFQPKEDLDDEEKGYAGRDFSKPEYGYDDAWSGAEKSGGSSSWKSRESTTEWNAEWSTDDPSSGEFERDSYEESSTYKTRSETTGRPSREKTGEYGTESRGPETRDRGNKYEEDPDSWGSDLYASGGSGEKYLDDDWSDDEAAPTTGTAEETSTATPARGIWRIWSWVTTRCQYSEPRMQREFDEAAELGLTDIVLHLNSGHNASRDPAFRFLDDRTLEANRNAVARAVDELRARDIDCHLMVFPAPTVRFAESMVEALVPLVEAAPIRSILLDAESNWRNRRGADYEGAVAVFEQRLHRELEDRSVALGFTDFTLTDVGRQLARICDYVMPQAYSTRSPGRREPGQMQREKHDLYRGLGKPIVLAVAAWHIRPPAEHRQYSPEETMAYTWEEVERLHSPGVTEVAYWSLPAAHSTRPRAEGPPFNTPAESRSILRFLREQGRHIREQHVFVPGARFL